MRKITLLTVLYLSFFGVIAQEGNLQSYTPSILFNKGDFEFKTFQNLYNQTRSFESAARKSEKSDRQTFFTSINQFLYGVNSQVNVGFDFWVKSTSLPNGNDRINQTGLSLIGPKIKVAPFKGLKRLSIQSSYLFPVVKDQENRTAGAENPFFFFSHDRSIWLTQFFYDLPINDKFQLFFQQAFWYSVVRNSFRANNYLETQTSVFFSYFPTSRWTVYGMSEYFPTHYSDNSIVELQQGKAFNSWFVQSGVGLKYQLIPGVIETEFLYTNFWLGSVGGGAGQTFNLGLRFISQK